MKSINRNNMAPKVTVTPALAVPKNTIQRILRWPLLIIICIIVCLELIAYISVRICVYLYELSVFYAGGNHDLRKALKTAKSYEEWQEIATQLDEVEGRNEWKKDSQSPYYNYDVLKDHLEALQNHRQSSEIEVLMKTLKVVYSSANFGGFANEQLYRGSHIGTKDFVMDFIAEVEKCTKFVSQSEKIPLHERIDWLKRLARSYGRTALMLSGGGAMGYYHIGVLKALHEANCLPRIISGASAGSLIGAYIAVRTDEEIKAMFDPSIFAICQPSVDSLFSKIRRWFQHGYMFDVNQWVGLLRRDFTKGDTTFAEAFHISGRAFNVPITSVSQYSPSIILNYKTAPDVIIWSAILASSAMPNLIPPVELLCKDRQGNIKPFHVHGKVWRDGTIKADIPITEISSMWNAKFYVVCQVNPHLTPFFYSSQRTLSRASWTSSGYRGGFILSTFEKLLKLEMKKWMQLLAELDLLPRFFGADWSTLWLQPVGGTITLVPEVTYGAYWNIINNPTYKTMSEYILRGERATWHRITRIQNHHRLEVAVKHCLRKLLKQKQIEMREFKLQTALSGHHRAQLPFEEEKVRGAQEFEAKENALSGVPLEDIEVDTPTGTQAIGRPSKHNLSKPSSPCESNRFMTDQNTPSLRRQSLSALVSTLATLARTSSTISPQLSADNSAIECEFQNLDDMHSRSPSPSVIPPVVFDETGKAFLTDEDYDDEDEPGSPSADESTS